jgi:cadmium resistance protein CadD (predicted permease)
MFDLVGGALAAWVVTNLDGFVLLTILFATPDTKLRTVVAGEYVGLAILVAVSVVGAVGLLVVPTRWVGVVGVVPFVGGIRALRRGEDRTSIASSVSVAAIVGLVVADGVDNVAVYTSVFRHLAAADIIVYVLVFACAAAVWCALAAALAGHRAVASTVEHWSHIVVPIVYIVVGLALIGTTLRA